MIGEPPSTGAVQVRDAVVLPAVAKPAGGAAGAVFGPAMTVKLAGLVMITGVAAVPTVMVIRPVVAPAGTVVKKRVVSTRLKAVDTPLKLTADSPSIQAVCKKFRH